MIVFEGSFQHEASVAWKQVDRILAEDHFKLLQKLHIKITALDNGLGLLHSKLSDCLCMSLIAAFPLLSERGVSVEARMTIVSMIRRS
jgi:hypothetical protein